MRIDEQLEQIEQKPRSYHRPVITPPLKGALSCDSPLLSFAS